MGRWKKDVKGCEGLVPHGTNGFKPCKQRAEWVVSHSEERHWCCNDHVQSFLSDKTMNIVLPAKECIRLNKM